MFCFVFWTSLAPHLYGDDGEGHPEGADRVGDEDEGDHHHDDSSNDDTLDRHRHHNQELE